MVSGVHQVMAADGDFPARLAEMQRDGRVSGLHTLLVSRGGEVLFEHYGADDDQSWGKPLGTVTFGPNVLHDLRSMTKCIVGMLYGIALAGGKVPPPEAKRRSAARGQTRRSRGISVIPVFMLGERQAPAPGGQSRQISFVNYFMRFHRRARTRHCKTRPHS
jgi:hypothetical protein